jgi:DNA primase
VHTWIDFKELRNLLRFSEVFAHYDVQLNVKGMRATGYCPLPSHQGKRRSPSFSVNLERGIWQCFGCHAKGNVLDFCCRMEGFNPDNPQELRKSALKIRDTFLGGGVSSPPGKPTREIPRTIINPALDFDLRTLDPNHPYLKERGFTDETIRHFGLGYCNRGMLKGRIAIPLHNPHGQLVGYAGRLTKDEDVSDRTPKYLFPGERVRNGVKLEFRKSLLLYNAHRIAVPAENLYVVEGFPATWWLWQADYRSTVALMGANCSREQAKLIVDLVKPDGRLWILTDGDDAGDRCAYSFLPLIAPNRAVNWVECAANKQPTDFGKHVLARMLTK